MTTKKTWPKGTASHTIGFPVFSVAFAPKKPRIAIGGGGGPNKSGVKNAVILYDINEETLEMKKIAAHFFGQDDDGCMSLALHPKEKSIVAAANSPDSKANPNCRVFTLKGESLILQNAMQTVENQREAYQRVACFSPDGTKLVTGSTEGKLVCWNWPDLKPTISPFDMNGEIYDVHFDFSSRMASPVISADKGKTLWSIEKPIMKKTIPCEFRASRFINLADTVLTSSRFGSGSSEGALFTLVNAKSRKKSFICKWDAKAWVLVKSTVVGLKPATAFAISNKGDLLAVGLSDASIHIFSTKSLQPRHTIQSAHGFPITSLAFSPSGATIASGSADGTVHLAKLPKNTRMFIFLTDVKILTPIL
ncbi:quinon protein alcohol dehydrogenase-like superfamily [Chytridium lagenaria]|nr:quinon protein alcohol dehydrogenase-like superfamily [Chytridium lagenaria]